MTMQIGTWSSTEPDIRMDHHHQTQPMYIQQNHSQVKIYPNSEFMGHTL